MNSCIVVTGVERVARSNVNRSPRGFPIGCTIVRWFTASDNLLYSEPTKFGLRLAPQASSRFPGFQMGNVFWALKVV